MQKFIPFLECHHRWRGRGGGREKMQFTIWFFCAHGRIHVAYSCYCMTEHNIFMHGRKCSALFFIACMHFHMWMTYNMLKCPYNISRVLLHRWCIECYSARASTQYAIQIGNTIFQLWWFALASLSLSTTSASNQHKYTSQHNIGIKIKCANASFIYLSKYCWRKWCGCHLEWIVSWWRRITNAAHGMCEQIAEVIDRKCNKL